MQIENTSFGKTGLEQTGQTADTQPTGSSTRGTGAQPSPSQTDGLQLSSFAGTLSQVLQSDSSGRSQRVAQLAAAVQSGSYQVDPQALSRAIVDHAISAGNSLP